MLFTLKQTEKLSREEIKVLPKKLKEFTDNIAAKKIYFVDNAIGMNFELAIKGLENKDNFGYKLRKASVNSDINPEEMLCFGLLFL